MSANLLLLRSARRISMAQKYFDKLERKEQKPVKKEGLGAQLRKKYFDQLLPGQSLASRDIALRSSVPFAHSPQRFI